VALLVEELPKGPSPEALPGVPRLLDALEREVGVLLGLLTGNLLDGARLKLDAAGIAHARFRVGAYGSDAQDRGELPSFARQRATALLGRDVLASELVIIGDTPADVGCGRGAGAATIAVATGRFDAATLAASGADHVFRSLEDEKSVVAAILG
jgi:phosphoglycolate phosphatase-like HAD superfamily hydrolase